MPNVKRILSILAEKYPDARCALDYTTPFELLIATMLSAQCTDERVNKVTAGLFPHVATPAAFAALTQEQLEEYIKTCGLFRAKAKNIIAMAKTLLAEHDGQVPATHEALQALPGVGRKTANVVLSNAFGVPAIAVDTHVFRVSNRLGLAVAKTPEATEAQLMKRIPKAEWSAAHHWLIHHGRRICHARKPDCDHCPLRSECAYVKKRPPAKAPRQSAGAAR